MPTSNWRIVDSATAFSAASSEDSDGNEASAEEKVKEKAEESEKGDTTEEASKDDGETSVDDGASGHSLNRLLPCWNMKIMVCKVYGSLVSGMGCFVREYTHARYHEKMPRTMQDIANSRERRKVEAARVPRANLDMLKVREWMWMGDWCDECDEV